MSFFSLCWVMNEKKMLLSETGNRFHALRQTVNLELFSILLSIHYLNHFTAHARCECEWWCSTGVWRRRRRRQQGGDSIEAEALLESRMLSHRLPRSCFKVPTYTGWSRGRLCLSCCWRRVRTVGGTVCFKTVTLILRTDEQRGG